jgi:SM-20-related protein
MLEPGTQSRAETRGPLNIKRVRSTSLVKRPFEHVIVSNFIYEEWETRLLADYPRIEKGGSFPLSALKFGKSFSKLIDAMDGAEFRQAVGEKFAICLEGRPTIFTVRGRCRLSDGRIHTDTESKLITVLLYMNQPWRNQGGQLRLLNSAENIDDVAAEVSPAFGTLLVFKRSDYSFHGHLPFEGERKVIQMNWVTEQRFADKEKRRHKLSALWKRLHLS